LDFFHFIGRVIGKAIHDAQNLEARWTEIGEAGCLGGVSYGTLEADKYDDIPDCGDLILICLD